jgi:hypothetical protein
MVDSDASPASTGALAYSSSARRWAVSSVSPMIGLVRKKTLHSSGSRPCFFTRALNAS